MWYLFARRVAYFCNFVLPWCASYTHIVVGFSFLFGKWPKWPRRTSGQYEYIAKYIAYNPTRFSIKFKNRHDCHARSPNSGVRHTQAHLRTHYGTILYQLSCLSAKLIGHHPLSFLSLSTRPVAPTFPTTQNFMLLVVDCLPLRWCPLNLAPIDLVPFGL
jgi:hypothetical protein